MSFRAGASLCFIVLPALSAVVSQPSRAAGGSSATLAASGLPAPARHGAYFDAIPDTGQFLPDTTVLARVGPRTIRARDFVVSYFNSYVEFRPRPDSLGRADFLNSMIDKDVMGMTALAINRPLGFEDRVVLREYTQRVLSNMLYQRVVLDSVKVTEDELRSVYEQLRYEQRFRHIVLADRPTAERVRGLLIGGRLPWAQAVRQHSIARNSSGADGDLGWIPRGDLEPAMARQIYGLRPLEISPVVEDRDGFHLVQCVERRGLDAPYYETVRSILLMELQTQQAAALSGRMRTLLTTQIGMSYDSVNIRWAAPHFSDTPFLRQDAGAIAIEAAHVPAFAEEDTGRVLARHRDGQLTLGSFLAVLSAMPDVQRPRVGNFDSFRAQVDAIVLEPHTVRIAEQRGLDRDPATVAQVERRREQLLVEQLYQDSVPSRVRLTPEERRRYYQDHIAEYHTYPEVRFASIVRATRAAADSLAARLRAGTRAENVLRADSLGGLQSGSIQERRSNDRGPYHKELFEELRPGQATVVGPDREGIWLVLQVLHHDPGRQLTYAEAEQYVDESLQNIRAEEQLKAFIGRLKKRYQIESHGEQVMRVRLADPLLN